MTCRLSWSMKILLAICTIHYWILTAAEIADYNNVPKGLSPTLYDAGKDQIVQLDETTFNDTIFCSERSNSCTSFVVEFYSDWCGHCRAYAPLYKALAHDINAWKNVVKVAAINCADPINEITCRANGVAFFPFLKYFPRNITDANFSVKLKPYQSLSALRDQITLVLVQDYAINHFADWPNFDRLGDISSFNIEELWVDVRPDADMAAIIFDSAQTSLIGAQLLLDLTKYSDKIVARRSMEGHPLAESLHIVDFPTLVVYRRGQPTPVIVTELRRLLISELEDYLNREDKALSLGQNFGSHKNQSDASATAIIEQKCAEALEDCKSRYYVSESDMLKAIHYALAYEVPHSGEAIAGSNLIALYNFVDLLANHFPNNTNAHNSDEDSKSDEVLLDASSRARVVFAGMRSYLQDHMDDGTTISANEWQTQFNRTKQMLNNPFPDKAEWEHCKGSTSRFRGYTCGLWTVFHTLTVSAFKNSQSTDFRDFRPIEVLQTIRGWVRSFFGCEHCRKHFLKMTTKTANIEARVKKNDDVFMYLWKAHNIVNKRLKNTETEDPEFPKFQFPAPFLCPKCRRNTKRSAEEGASPEEFDESIVRDYLIGYYSSIKPISE